MKKVTLKALKQSIRHWEEDCPDDGMRGDNCALCRRFREADNAGICKIISTGERCPVYKKSGYPGCVNTPYEKFPTPAQRLEEIAFLKSLLPKAERK